MQFELQVLLETKAPLILFAKVAFAPNVSVQKIFLLMENSAK
jgi:hypothetical protein